MNNQDLINKTLEFVKNIHSTDYSGHDFEHIKRVWKTAKLIAQSEPQANLFIVEMAALLHDVDDYKLRGDTHYALEWLEKSELSENTIQQILSIIDRTGFSKTGYNPRFEDIESKIVYDADKLDAIGAIGVARTFAYGGAKSRPLFDPDLMPKEHFSLNDYKDQAKQAQNHTINHFFDKVIKLASIMQTALGKKIAIERQRTMLDFLKAFFTEQGLVVWDNLLEHEMEQYKVS